MRALAIFAVVLLAPLVVVPPAHAAVATDYTISVGGVDAHGLLAVPVGAPRGIVVIAHGYGHTSASHRGHIEHLADEGFVAVAMDFRGTGFPLRAGADDTEAATRDLMATYPGIPVTLYSVSMGTAVASMVLAELPVFDTWVDNEGLAMLGETYAEASALAPANAFAKQAVADIEAECGHPAPATCLGQRSAVLRAPEFRNLKGAVVAHAFNDGLVPFDQGREMESALRAIGVPTDFYAVIRGNVGGEGTTITGYGGQNIDGLTGHGTESDDSHTMTKLTFDLLDQVLAGSLVPANRENVVDREIGMLP